MDRYQEEPFVIIPFLPPSSNHIYVSGRGGGRFLSEKAKYFKLRAISHIQSTCLAQITKLDRTTIYSVWYNFFFPLEELINKTFGQGKQNSAESRYKRMDVENRIKLVSDAFSTAIGIDDCQFFEGGHSKFSSGLVGDLSQLHIFLSSQDPKKFGI